MFVFVILDISITHQTECSEQHFNGSHVDIESACDLMKSRNEHLSL